jgi:hypothetical protein
MNFCNSLNNINALLLYIYIYIYIFIIYNLFYAYGFNFYIYLNGSMKILFKANYTLTILVILSFIY